MVSYLSILSAKQSKDGGIIAINGYQRNFCIAK
jgi:hypothetical protein